MKVNKLISLKSTTMLAVFLTVLLASSCGAVQFDAKDIKQADELCKDSGGVKSINRVMSWVLPNYICNNGTSFEIYRDKIIRIEPVKK